jgi:hypothetical protein
VVFLFAQRLDAAAQGVGGQDVVRRSGEQQDHGVHLLLPERQFVLLSVNRPARQAAQVVDAASGFFAHAAQPSWFTSWISAWM